MSCNVPGHEILQLSNWTRQRYEVGIWNQPKCPANMLAIDTLKDCRMAADVLGLDFKKDMLELMCLEMYSELCSLFGEALR